MIKKSFMFSAILVIAGLFTKINVFASPLEQAEMELLNNTNSCNILKYSYLINSDNAPSFIPANEHEEIGPDTFFVSEDIVFVDDTVNNRILVYNREDYFRSISLPWYMDITLMYYDIKEDVLKVVYEDRNDSYIKQYMVTMSAETGEMVSKVQELSNQDKRLLEYCFDSDGNLLTLYLNEDKNNEKMMCNIDLSMLDAENVSAGVYTENKTLTAIGNKAYNLFSTFENEGANLLIKECIVITEEQKVISYVTPEFHQGALNRGDFQVTSNGIIYQMVADDKEIKIFQLSEKASIQDEKNFLTRKMELEEQYSVEPSVVNSQYKSMSADAIGMRAFKYLGLSWTFNSTKNSNLSVTGTPSKVTQPSWLTALADGNNHSVVGVPYCWGGWNAESFITNINSGKFAGNVNTTASGLVSGTVGMDCSGYVSVAFDLPYKHGTSNLNLCFTRRSNNNDVQPYDILNKSGSHVVIVISTYVSNGVRYVNTCEESSGSGKVVQRMDRNYASLISEGFVPMKYNYLQ